MFKEFEVVEVISCFFSSWLVSNGGGDYFLVEERTGSIKLARPLDYESIKSYLITVVSIDGGGLKVGGASNWAQCMCNWKQGWRYVLQKLRLKVWATRNETQFQMKVVAKMRLNFKIGVARKEA